MFGQNANREAATKWSITVGGSFETLRSLIIVNLSLSQNLRGSCLTSQRNYSNFVYFFAGFFAFLGIKLFSKFKLFGKILRLENLY